MLLCNAYVKCPFGYLLHHDAHTAAGGHCGCDGHDLPVGPGELQQGLSEYVLVSGGCAGGGYVALAGHGVECPGGVPYGLVLLRWLVALALFCDDMQEFGAFDVAQGGEGGGQLTDVVAVDGPEVPESEGLEQGAPRRSLEEPIRSHTRFFMRLYVSDVEIFSK